MKILFFEKRVLGMAVAVLCLTDGLSLPAASAQDQPAPAPADAALPADIAPDSQLAQVVRLAQTGVNEAVILAFINNSGSPFNLTADQIIYLKDLGLPDDAVTAMIQRDQQLGATATAAPAPDTTTQTETPEQPAEVTQNYFYDTLSPYGNWVDVEGYGLCWQPVVVIYNSSWQPYCDHGHWVYTEDGWYWLSDYSWGATAFHYGRWFHDPRHGWCWWPNTAWAPSWVTWRYGDDYCGWAPLPPHTVYREGAGFFYNGVAVSAGFDFGIGVNFFTFVPTRDFCDPHPRRFRVAPGQVTKFYSRTAIINDFHVDSRSHGIINGGIPPQRITAVTRTEIHPVAIRETSAPARRGEQIDRDTLVVNRPHFDADAATTLNRGIRPRPMMVPWQNTPHPSIPNENRNNFNPRPEAPAQNNFPQTGRSRDIPPAQPQNDFQRPPMNQTPPARNPQIGAPVQIPPATPPQVPQNRDNASHTQRPVNQADHNRDPRLNYNQPSPQMPPANQARVPQNRVAPQQPVAPVVRNPQVGSPAPNPYMSPRMREQSPRATMPRPEARVITPSRQPQINNAPRIEQQPANEPPPSRVTPPAQQGSQPSGSQPASSTQSGQQKSGRGRNQNGPGN
ncbi:MAG TPA: DUF6600 domain-containing protein [Verrucomicrobiae bacterium]